MVRKSGSRLGRRVRASIQATRTLASTNKLSLVCSRAAVNPLRKTDAGRAFNRRLTGRDQLIVEFGRASVLDVQTHHCKQNPGLLRQLQLREPQ